MIFGDDSFLSRFFNRRRRKITLPPRGFRVNQDPTDDEVAAAIRSVPKHYSLRTIYLGFEATVRLHQPSVALVGTATDSLVMAASVTKSFNTQTGLGLTTNDSIMAKCQFGTMVGPVGSYTTGSGALDQAVAYITGSGTGTKWVLMPYTTAYVDFGCRGGSIEVDIDDEECGDSLTGAAKARKPGRFDAACSLDFYERPDVTNFGAGSATANFLRYAANNQATLGAEIAVEVFPNGNTAGTAAPPWLFPSLVLQVGRVNWAQDGKMEGSISGRTNQHFQMAG